MNTDLSGRTTGFIMQVTSFLDWMYIKLKSGQQ